MLSSITYEDKVALNENADIPDKNKIKAEDMNMLKNVINNNFNELLNLLCPIGRGFIDFTDTDYSNYLGFTWERELVGMTAVGLDATQTEFNQIGKVGGEKTHILTINEMPTHNHMGKTYSKNFNTGETIPRARAYARSYSYDDTTDGVWKYSGSEVVSGAEITDMIETSNSGGNQPHNNLQPYKVVAYWKRIA